jgi:hypothetical protein
MSYRGSEMQMVGFKVFKTYLRARRCGDGRPIVRIGDVYLVPEATDPVDIKLTSIELWHGTSDTVVGCVTLDHLNRLGNANHATANPGWSCPRIF